MTNNSLFSWPFIFSILVTLCTLLVSGDHECLGSQQSLLLQLKNSLDFNSSDSTKLVTWNESSDCCSWKGVACEEGRVTHLDLSGEAISGGLDNSSTLFNLQHLKSLDLSWNYFNSTIPSRIGNLTNLINLDLHDTGFVGQIPTEISHLRSLVTLELSSYFREGTNLSSPVPEFFAKFSNLTLLNLRAGCELKGTFPSEIFQVPTLQYIDLSFNEFLEGTLPEFQINNSLQELRLSSTNFSGKLPASLGNLWNLSTLDLSKCLFNDKLLSSMSNLTQLHYVDLSSNNFTGRVPSFHMSTKLDQLDLSNNSLGGEIPLHLFVHPYLMRIWLSNNQFSGPIPEFKTSTSSLLDLDLSRNNLEGLLPTSIFKLGNLRQLDLSHNKFNGTKHKKQMFYRYVYLDTLDLSCNSFKSFHGLENLPAGLSYLNLSNNHILGELPKSFFHFTSLRTLDLHFNQLQGNIPVLPPPLLYLDLSSNNFTAFQYEIFNNLSEIQFFSVSNNSLTGVIPEHICAIERLVALDLSHNNFSGKIPTCLFETSPEMLNLHKNNFEGPIPDVFPRKCALKALDLNGNFIEGEIPKSLANCSGLEFLDLGHNKLVGKFPCLLKNVSNLQVLILRSNKLYGSIGCPNADGSWPMLQIFDAAHNNFSGELPRRWLTELQGMAVTKGDSHVKALRLDGGIVHLKSKYDRSINWHMSWNRHFEYTVTVTSKRLEMELVKILDIFTCIDLSKNNFHGQIPIELGQLHALYTLNLSHNTLTGQIPSSIGNLQDLESLDLSWNNLTGTIPTQLQSLNFLQVLNLSFNQLVGMIPTGNQIQTFSEDSFIGNKGLCGFPLTKNCSDKVAPGSFLPSATKENHSNSGRKIDWNLLSAEIGLFTGFGVVVSPLVFSRRWRIWYYESVDDIIFKIFPLAVSRKWFLWTTI